MVNDENALVVTEMDGATSAPLGPPTWVSPCIRSVPLSTLVVLGAIVGSVGEHL